MTGQGRWSHNVRCILKIGLVKDQWAKLEEEPL